MKQITDILQSHIPEPQRQAAAARLPAMQPVGRGDWLSADDAFGAQLAEKARLLDIRRADVLQVLPAAEDAVRELFTVVLAELALKPDYAFDGAAIVRPDGARIEPDPARPMESLSQLVQEDFCILQRIGDEHVLTGALLCFPAAWTLSEKIGRPLTGIHVPVKDYDDGIAKRVQRLFDGVQPGRPLWRANLLRYESRDLFQPHTEAAPRPVGSATSRFERSERQTVLRLSGTGAVVFSIHTTMIERPET